MGSELTAASWPPYADVPHSAVSHLAFIYIYIYPHEYTQAIVQRLIITSEKLQVI